MEKTIEIPEGYEARIEGNKVILERKESEDERAMRMIKNTLREAAMSEFISEISYGEMLAYLERQKENPKNADSIPADCASSAKCENEHNKPGDFVFELRQIISRHRYADLYGECVDDEEGMAREIMALCEQQKEQKPAEGTALQKAFISSKIDYTLEEKCDASDYAEVILPTSVAYGEDDEEYKLHKIIEAAFIAGQKKEQKPAEWSEEDERGKELLYVCQKTAEREHRSGVREGRAQAEKELIPLINRLCEAILFEWKDVADLARKTLTQIKAQED